jgi:tetratricopeptide (TPR) repeat protein
MEAKKYFWKDKQGNIYGPFRMDEEGNPHGGDVVQHYRLLKHLSPKALGAELGKTKRWVTQMEHDNMVPELISRRKALLRVLGIPPVLLFPNIYADDDLVRLETLESKPLPAQEYRSNPSGSLDLRCYAEMLSLYWSMFDINGAQHVLSDVEGKICLLHAYAADACYKERHKALSLLCQYRMLAAMIAEHRASYEKALVHYQQAIAVAEEINDPGLQAVSYLRRGITHKDQGNMVEAATDLKQAYSFKEFIPSAVAVRTRLVLGNVTARLARRDEEQAQEALTLIEQAGKIVRDGRKEEDPYGLNLHEGKYHIANAQALMATGHLDEAEEALQLAHETSAHDLITDHNYLDILQVRLAMQSQQYVIATSTALQALDVAEQFGMRRNIQMLAGVHQQLLNTGYGKSSDVRDLGKKLREWNKTSRQLH